MILSNRFRSGASTLLPALIAIIGWTALATELGRSLTASLEQGRGIPEALFLYFRFFTILSNVFVAALMTVTVFRRVRDHAPVSAPWYNAALVYIIVTGITYEAMLRVLWTPAGVPFWTDLMLHDVVPATTLVFWLSLAPRRGARWRDALMILVFPIAYFVATLVAGALGESYPYGFLDVAALGYAQVVANGIVFLAIFLVLALATTAVCRLKARPKPPVDGPRRAFSV